VRIEFVSKSSIPYENGGPVALCVNGAMIVAIDEIRTLPEVEAVKKFMIWTNEGGLGGRIPPVVTTIEGV
jgi:hypothetical protein